MKFQKVIPSFLPGSVVSPKLQELPLTKGQLNRHAHHGFEVLLRNPVGPY